MKADYPCLIRDARYEWARESETIAPQAVMIVLGIDENGRRCVPAVEREKGHSSSA